MIKLRPYQEDALRLSKERYDAGVCRQLIALPTGTGKTIIFAHAKMSHLLDGRVLVLVHRKELAYQAREKFEKLGYNVGLELEDESSWSGNQIVVAMVQALGRASTKRTRKFNPDDFGLIICDEAHHSVASTYQNVFRYFGVLDGRSRALLLGVTATPVRSDGKGLGDVFQEIVYHMDIRDAVIDGWLVDVKGARARTQASLDRVRILPSGDFDTSDLSSAVNLQVRNELVLKTWRERAHNRQTIVFCADVKHAKDMAATFRNAGIRAEAISGKDRDSDRSDKLQRHKAGKLQVLTNCEVLTEGYDDWSVNCIVMARPTQSELLFVQMVGRGTRIPAGIDNLNDAKSKGVAIVKADCLVIDVVDSTSKHSLITLPTLFGLPKDYDYAGRSVAKRSPQDHSSSIGLAPNLNIASGVKPHIKDVDLLKIRWRDPLFATSVLQWFTTGTGDQVLTLPKGDSFKIRWIRTGWEVLADLVSERFTSGPFPSLDSAFRDVEHSLHTFCQPLINELRGEARLPPSKATPLQLEILESIARGRRSSSTKWSRQYAQRALIKALFDRYASNAPKNPASKAFAVTGYPKPVRPTNRIPPPSHFYTADWFGSVLKHWSVKNIHHAPRFSRGARKLVGAQVSRNKHGRWTLEIFNNGDHEPKRWFATAIEAISRAEEILSVAGPEQASRTVGEKTNDAPAFCTQIELLRTLMSVPVSLSRDLSRLSANTLLSEKAAALLVEKHRQSPHTEHRPSSRNVKAH